MKYSKKSNTLPLAIQENIIAHAVRDAGYDCVLGYSKRRDNTYFISEIFDVRGDLLCLSSLIKFKWPNDVLWGEYKIGGILLEEKKSNLLAGIGLNLIFAPPVSALREDSALPAGSIAELGRSFIKNPSFSPFSMWQSLVSMMRFWYELEVLPVKAKNHMQLIEPELAWKGCLVRVCDYFTQEKMPVKTGRVLGLGSQGELCLLIEGREELIVSGSICLA